MRSALFIALGLAWMTPAAEAAQALMPQVRAEDDYGETFTFIADFDDGTYVQLQLGVTNLGPGSRHGLCRGMVKAPRGSAWSAFERFSESEWRWTGGEEEKLTIGPCWATSGASGTRVHVAVDGRTVDLAFPSTMAPEPAPGSPIKKGDRTFEAWTALRFTRVSATLELRSSPRTSLEGGGYADHSRSTAGAKDLAKSWVRFRALRSPGLLFSGRLTEKGETAPVWLWREGEEPKLLTRFAARRSGGTRAEPTWKATFEGEGMVGTIASTSLVFRHAPVEEIGGVLASLLTPLVGSPVTWTHRATLRLSDGTEAEGILEVEFSDE